MSCPRFGQCLKGQAIKPKLWNNNDPEEIVIRIILRGYGTVKDSRYHSTEYRLGHTAKCRLHIARLDHPLSCPSVEVSMSGTRASPSGAGSPSGYRDSTATLGELHSPSWVVGCITHRAIHPRTSHIGSWALEWWNAAVRNHGCTVSGNWSE
jgi:hypothetical protein